ncbi:MAG: SAM-dependent methyltransferase [Propionibacteriaceae bacterium]|nr:SAM-dependent methyltransferase [Propionibacteriaceae bacterium]
MKVETARWLVSDQGRELLGCDLDPDSLADASRLRRSMDAERAAAVMGQVALRRKAVTKFGSAAAGLFFTPAGLEQASRPDVARWRARRFASTGAGRVVDLGCGLGTDALALLSAGIEVRAVEIDPVTAVFAEANLGIPVTVADATQVPVGVGEAVFADPARRTARGRTWRVADFSPPWDFVTGLLKGRTACLKLGPGVPHAMLPRDCATTWISHRGDVVEASVWSGAGTPGSRTALLLPGGLELSGEETTGTAAGEARRAERREGPGRRVEIRLGDLIVEPDGAIIRAGLTDVLASRLGAVRIHPEIAYLYLAAAHDEQALARVSQAGACRAFRVLDVMAYHERTLKAWVRDQRIGCIEIKKRGIDVDPAVLRRRLRPHGDAAATLILTPTPDGARAISVQRLG